MAVHRDQALAAYSASGAGMARVLRRIGRTVGQIVIVTANGRGQQDRIVGRAVFPNFGQGGFTPTDLGLGAETTAAVLQPQASSTVGGPHYEA